MEESDYQQLRSILTFKRPCLCFMRRRPIQKIERSPVTLIFGVCFNWATTLIYYVWLREKTHGTEAIFMDTAHVVLYWTSIALLLICIPMFVLAASLKPGYIKPVYDFISLIEQALEIGLHLDNFCSHCEVIKPETSFHCTICNKCV